MLISRVHVHLHKKPQFYALQMLKIQNRTHLKAAKLATLMNIKEYLPLHSVSLVILSLEAHDIPSLGVDKQICSQKLQSADSENQQ